MNRLLLLISIVGAAAYMGYLKVPVATNPSSSPSSGGSSPLAGTLAQRVFQVFDTKDTKQTTSTSAAPGASADTSRSLGMLAQRVLQPFENQPFISIREARQTLDQLQSDVAAHSSEPDYRRNVQAVNMLGQAVEERSGFLKRLMSGTTTNALDKVPGKWHLVGHPETSVNPTEISRLTRSSFWTQVTLREWRARCDY